MFGDFCIVIAVARSNMQLVGLEAPVRMKGWVLLSPAFGQLAPHPVLASLMSLQSPCPGHPSCWVSPAQPLVCSSAGGEGGGGRRRAWGGLAWAEALHKPQAEASHVQPGAPAPAPASGTAGVTLLIATAGHPRGQGHHRRPRPLGTGESHLLLGEEVARNQPGRRGGVPGAGRWVCSHSPGLAARKTSS